MATDLDPLDEIFPERAANNARAGGKFQPKAKPRPRKESSAPLPPTQSVQAVDIAKDELTALEGPSVASLETLETTRPLKSNKDSVSGFNASDDSALGNPPLEHHVIGETLGHDVVLHSDLNGDWHSTIGKSAGESTDIFFGLESLDDFYSQSTTATVSATNRSPDKVDLSVQLGNEFVTLCPVNNKAEGSLVPSEISSIQVSDTRSAEGGPLIPVVSPRDDSAVRLSNTSLANTCPGVTIVQDPLTCGEAIVSDSDGDFGIYNRGLEIEFQEAEDVPCLETLDNLLELTTRSGQRCRKFLPKPKDQIDRLKPGASTSHLDGVASVACFQNAQCVPSESEYMNEDSVPAIPQNNVLDFSSLRCGDSTSELPGNEEPMNLVETCCSDAFIPGEHLEAVPDLEKVSQSAKHRKRKTSTVPDDSLEHQKTSISGPENEAGRSTRQLRKRINACELLDESEDEAHDDGDFTNECPSGSLIDENDNDDGDYQVDNETRNRREPRKSKKSAPQKEKPVRKRKKVNEEPDQATKEPPKKFSHTTRRKRRQVDKVLLETPEDEIDVRKLRIRDLILLADYRERTSSREGKTLEAPSTNQSAGHSFADYNEDENFASEQGGGSSYDQRNPAVQESYTNYQSYMNKTPRSRWSKQDTELFYEAVRQFGSDISMIQQLFPGRTRTQVKLKYKKEERQHPLRLHDALTTRAKDHSHFQTVIEHLQQLAAQEKQESYRDDSIGLTGDEEEVNPEINEEVAKPEQVEEGEVEAVEPDVSEVLSPVKSHDSDDDVCRWSQYKSEL